MRTRGCHVHFCAGTVKARIRYAGAFTLTGHSDPGRFMPKIEADE